MLNPADLYEAVHSLSPRRRAAYEIGHPASVLACGVLCALIVGGLSALLARWLIDVDVTTDGLMGAIIIPAVMAYIFVLAGARRVCDPSSSLRDNMVKAARRNLVAGLGVGFLSVGFIHFLGQLVMARAIYGPLEFHSRITSYCGVVPVVYGLLFATPIALGCALFAAYVTASGEWVYSLVMRIPEE